MAEDLDYEDNTESGLSMIPPEIADTPLNAMTPEAIRVTALMMAVKYHGDTIVKEGALYQQLKLDGKELRPSAPNAVLESAIEFERYLRGDYAAQVDQLVGGDFDKWLKAKAQEIMDEVLEDECNEKIDVAPK